VERRVSLIIPVYNGSKYIRKVLDAVLAQTVKPHEVLVVDDGSSDDTREIVSAVAGVRLIAKQHTGLPDTRNHGIKEAKCELVCFLDSDIVLEPDWLQEMLKCDFDSFEAATGYVDTFNKGRSQYCKLDEMMLRRAFDKKPQTLSMENRRVNYFNYIIRADVFDRVGAFDPMFKTNGEDIDFFYRMFRAGMRISYVPSAVCHHIYVVESFWQWMRKRRNYSMAALVDMKYPGQTGRKVSHYGRVIAFIFAFALLFAAPLATLALFAAFIAYVAYNGYMITEDLDLAGVYVATVCLEQLGRIRETFKWHLGYYRGGGA
jgi:GT2 family glycosyltransferase